MSRILQIITYGVLHHKYLWTLLAFIVLVGFVDTNSFLRRYELHKQNEELRSEIAKFEEKYQHDSKELKELQGNPDAVERVARVNLYMKTANEDIYVIE